MRTQKYLLTLFCLSICSGVWAQAAVSGAVTAQADQALPTSMAWVFGTVIALLFIASLAFIVKTNQILYKKVLNLEAAKSGVVLPSESLGADVRTGEDFWTRIRKKYWEDAVPMEREGEIMLDHGYDNIRELDNRLPPWWVNMFLLTIAWAAVYMWYYHWGGNGPSSGEEYKRDVERAKKEIAVAVAGHAAAIDETSVTALTDAGAIGEGELIFKNVCAACHGQKGEGTVGPNFTDEYWIHGGGIKNVFKTIKYGVPEKGMISWQSQLKPSDIQKVASYILTLKGTNPPNPKAPQGEIWKDEGATESAAPADPKKATAAPATGK